MANQGAHYQLVSGEQHHERAMRLGLNWYAGNITKYAERAPHKGQLVEDLIKILDYAHMWLEHYELTSDQLRRLQEIESRPFDVADRATDGEPNKNYVDQG